LWSLIFCFVVIPIRCTPAVSDACCSAFASGAFFQIADQHVLIYWDPETKIEHFVRKAGFRKSTDLATGESASADHENFGFLVPSPTKPTIEAPDKPPYGDLFFPLQLKISPRVETVRRTRWEIGSGLLAPFLLLSGRDAGISVGSKTSSAAVDSVQVLESKTVAGYDVVVLKASDASALTDWLQENGYDARPALREWAEPYIAKDWIITAFKYSTAGDVTVAESIRISFKTDRALFPFRVPVDQIAKEGNGALLRTYVIGPGRAQGTLGEGDDSNPWNQAKLRYAMPVEDIGAIAKEALPEEAWRWKHGFWLTVFDDPTWPSGTQDLWFDFDWRAESFQEVIHRVAYDRRMIPVDLLLLAGIIGVVFLRRAQTTISN
jgi:hypothetical protein